MHWVEDNQHWFLPYVRDIADRMGLQDWRFNVLFEDPTDDDAAASCEPIYGRRTANLRFGIPVSPEALRWSVVHELVHCHGALVMWNVNSIHPALSQQTFDVWHGSFMDAVELMTDGIAMAWAETLPLPEHEIEVNSGTIDRDSAEAGELEPGTPEPVAPDQGADPVTPEPTPRWEVQPDGSYFAPKPIVRDGKRDDWPGGR